MKEDKSNKEMKKTISHRKKASISIKRMGKAHPTYLTDENLYITCSYDTQDNASK